MTEPEEPFPSGWTARMLTVEAMALLTLARLLIAVVRFGRWRGWLGDLGEGPALAGSGRMDRYFARVVERAAGRLPFPTKCLPRAIALHWMLHRRGRPSALVIATIPSEVRGSTDDLHAWVEQGPDILIGDLDRPYRRIARFTFARL